MRVRPLAQLALLTAAVTGAVAWTSPAASAAPAGSPPPSDPPARARAAARPTRDPRPPEKAPVVAEAAARGDLAAVRRLLAAGGDVNAAQGDGMTALHWAADRGDSAMTVALLRAKADVHARTRIGAYAPLHVAARAGNPAVVRALLAAGADAKETTATGATALHLAAYAGDPSMVKALIAKGGDPNARESVWGQTPLVFAAERDRADAVRALIAGGADPSIRTRVVDLMDQQAREQAAKKKRDAILIGFEPKARKDSADADHKRALEGARAQFAQLQAQARAAGLLPPAAGAAGGAGGADAAAKPDSAATAAAMVARDPGALVNAGGDARALLNFAARMPERQPRGPFTPEQIQAAIDSGRAVYLAAALPKDSVREQVDTANGGVAGYVKQVGKVGGLTPLHHAARQGSVAAAIALVEGGAKLDDTTLVDRMTPLMIAATNGQFDVALQLVQRGANPNIVTTYGMSPLYAVLNAQWAPRSRYPQPQAIATQKTAYIEVVAALLAKGADPNARLQKQPWWFAYNNCGSFNCGLEVIDGTTPFWRAAYALDVEAMRMLKKAGASDTMPSLPPRQNARGGGAGAAGAAGAPGAARPDSAAGTRVAGRDSARATRMASAAGGAGAGAAAAAGGRPAGAPGGAGAAPRDPLAAPGGFRYDPEVAQLMRVAPVGAGAYPIHCAAGVGYGNGFAGNAHRYAPDGWMPTLRYLVEELGHDVNARDNNGYTPLHHAAARGDNEMIKYLVAKGADVKAVSRTGRTVVDMANGPVQRLRPFPETIELLEKLGAKNQHHCVSC